MSDQVRRSPGRRPRDSFLALLALGLLLAIVLTVLLTIAPAH
jgi:MYXO-CTERM domain-containing protein